MNHRAYLDLLMCQPIDWLRQCEAEPSPFMTDVHRVIVRLAIRKKGGRVA